LLRVAAAAGLAILVLATGCGDDGLSAARRDRLHERIADAREAAGSDDAAGARRALIAFRRDVRAGRSRGEITRADADRLLRGALQASRRVTAEITPEPTPSPSATAAPTATPAPTAFAPSAPTPPVAPGEAKGKGKGHGKGKGKDR
jgi:hypothetical protein